MILLGDLVLTWCTLASAPLFFWVHDASCTPSTAGVCPNLGRMSSCGMRVGNHSQPLASISISTKDFIDIQTLHSLFRDFRADKRWSSGRCQQCSSLSPSSSPCQSSGNLTVWQWQSLPKAVPEEIKGFHCKING